MPSVSVRKFIAILNGYPEWAKDEVTREKIDTIANRLIQLATDYQSGMYNNRTSKSLALELLETLMDGLHTVHPLTLRLTVNSYHLKPEFMKLLHFADQLRTQAYVDPKQLTKTANDINRINAANLSCERKRANHQPIINAANLLTKTNPSLSTTSIAKRLSKEFPDHKVGTIRNILTPLNKKRK